MVKVLRFEAHLVVAGWARRGELRCTPQVVTFSPERADGRLGARKVVIEREALTWITVTGRRHRLVIVTPRRRYRLRVDEPYVVASALRVLLDIT